MIWRWIEIILSQHLEYPKCCWIIPIKMVNLYHILFIKSSSDGNIAWAVMNMCLFVYLYKYLFSLLLGMCFAVELLGYIVIFFPVFFLLPLSHLHRRHSHTVLTQSLWGPWVLVHTRFAWALWASLAGMGFDSKREFTPPTVLLGFLLCPWTWDISSQSRQCYAEAAPAPTGFLGLLYPWT